ncbi:transposase [Rhizobium laguerreae]|nr:transposase [Rhizobium laguerreae]MBY3356180.1 transposase [Rhizobium laguerreae]MBY3370203.1 transposase [Rhizobium laguerreae]MBY3377088.1 transposase [Rhizobium laguerreae]MBY3391029.1 transposase [Rhizobium laguerreae]
MKKKINPTRFWKALDDFLSSTKYQRCWVHKTANILNKVPKSVQDGMKASPARNLSRSQPGLGRDRNAVFVEKYDAKYAKAVDCLTKDQNALLAFYDLPAEHWDHLRTSIPSKASLPPFATARCVPRAHYPQKPLG